MAYLNKLAEIPLPITVNATIPKNSVGLKDGKYKPDYLAYQLSRIAKSSDNIEDISIGYESTFTKKTLTKKQTLATLESLFDKSFGVSVSTVIDGVSYIVNGKQNFEPKYLYELLQSKEMESADLLISLNDIVP